MERRTPTPSDWEAVVVEGWRRGQALGVVGPGDPTVHLDHARALSRVIGDDVVTALDLGTGAGIPGLALVGLLPHVRWTLIDSARRRIRLVVSVVQHAGWSRRVTVVHGRAEDLGRRPALAGRADVVTARLFGPPPVTAECAAPFLRPGGRLLVTEPPADAVVDHERRWPAGPLGQLGLRPGPRLQDPSVQVLIADGRPDPRFPRRAGVASRRPLWRPDDE